MAKQKEVKLLAFILVSIMVFSFAMSVNAGFIFGGDEPDNPPPPTPCDTDPGGCYDKSGARQQSGSLSPGDFGYHYGQTVCHQDSSCTQCPAGSDPDISQDTNPDASSGACGCIFDARWDPQGKCCGDDANDCGRVTSSGILCTLNTNDRNAQWVASSDLKGGIVYAGCRNREFLSDGDTWRMCDRGNLNLRKINGPNQENQYMCTGDPGAESWVECCGNGQCNSAEGGAGKRLFTGESVIFSNDPFWFRGQWSPCTVECGGGTQDRTVECRQYRAGSVQKVADNRCGGTKPGESRSCNVAACGQPQPDPEPEPDPNANPEENNPDGGGFDSTDTGEGDPDQDTESSGDSDAAGAGVDSSADSGVQ